MSRAVESKKPYINENVPSEGSAAACVRAKVDVGLRFLLKLRVTA